MSLLKSLYCLNHSEYQAILLLNLLGVSFGVNKLIAIFPNPDHIHIFISLKKLDLSISQLVKEIIVSSTNFINEKKMVQGKFFWQEGYGAFSYAKSQKDVVTKYILNQEEHHKKRSFREEYLDLLNKFEIEFKEEYLFEFYD